MMQRRTGSTVLCAAAAAAAGALASVAFVPSATGPTGLAAPSLRGAGNTPERTAPLAGLAGAAGTAVLVAAASGVSSRAARSARRAEPISTAAAAAALAAKAAAAAKAGSAVAAGAKATGAAAGAKAAGATTAAGAGTSKSLSGQEEDTTGGNPDFDPAKQVGATAPLGFFDPAGFAKKGDAAGFCNLQASEIKHGRVAMMAALGAVVQHSVRIPGFEKLPAGLAAAAAEPGTYGFAALFVVAGALELGAWTESPSKEPGNFGDPLGLNQYNTEMRNKEINNGRAAMFAAIGIIAADLLTGKDGIEQLGLA